MVFGAGSRRRRGGATGRFQKGQPDEGSGPSGRVPARAGQEVKPAFIKAHLCVYVDALIVNPAFDSQTKETLTTKERSFGSKLVLPEKFLKAIEKSGVVDRVLAWTKFKQDEQLKRKGGSKKMRLTGITKLDDANCAAAARHLDR